MRLFGVFFELFQGWFLDRFRAPFLKVFGSILAPFWEAFGLFWHSYLGVNFRCILGSILGRSKTKAGGGSGVLAVVFGLEGGSSLIPHSHGAPGKQGLADIYIYIYIYVDTHIYIYNIYIYIYIYIVLFIK